MKQAALVIVKPDGISKGLVGDIFTKFNTLGLDVVAMRVANISRELAEMHYHHLKGKPFFKETVDFFFGKFHKRKQLVVIIYYGENAIKKCRKIAGATNPEEADPESIRGAYGRITTKGVFENVVHVSSNKKEAEREVKLWFNPSDIIVNLYPIKIIRTHKEKVWK